MLVLAQTGVVVRKWSLLEQAEVVVVSSVKQDVPAPSLLGMEWEPWDGEMLVSTLKRQTGTLCCHRV